MHFPTRSGFVKSSSVMDPPLYAQSKKTSSLQSTSYLPLLINPLLKRIQDLDTGLDNVIQSAIVQRGEAYSQANKILQQTDDLRRFCTDGFVNLTDQGSAIRDFVENESNTIIGVYEKGQWVVPDDLPDASKYKTGIWVNITQMNSIYSNVGDQITLLSDISSSDLLRIQNHFQKIQLFFSTVTQIIGGLTNVYSRILQNVH